MSQWCLDFDGVNDYAACGDVPTGGLSALTVEAWVRLDAAEAGGIVCKWVATTAEEWKLEVDVSRIVSFKVSYDGGKTTTATDLTALTLGVWYHVAGVVDSSGGEVRLYVDGEEVASTALASGAASANLMANYFPENYWPVNYWPDMPAAGAITIDDTAQPVEFGRLDGVYASLRLAWVRISNSVRYSASFEPARYPLFIDANTLAQWDFIEGTGTTLNNRETTATYDASVTGATWRWDAPDRADLWGDAYERFGDKWTILVGSGSTDITDLVEESSISILEAIGSNRDTAVFRMVDVAASDAPTVWSHVQIWHGGTLVFGGIVLATDKLITGIYLDVVCHCVDWTALLDVRVIAERVSWTATNAQTILKDITEDNWVTEIDATTYTDTGATSLDVDNDYGYVIDLVRKLADGSGYEWFVREDEEGDIFLHFTDNYYTAPFSLSTSPDLASSFPVRVIQWSETGSDMANHFFLVVEGVPDTATLTTGGTLGNVVLLQDRTIVEVFNSPSITAYGYIDRKYNVKQDEKALYTTDYLTAQGDPRIIGRAIVRFPHGLRPGMAVTLVHSVLDVNDSYVIQSMKTEPQGGGSIRYELTLGNFAKPKNSLANTFRKMRNAIEIASRRDFEAWVKQA